MLACLLVYNVLIPDLLSVNFYLVYLVKITVFCSFYCSEAFLEAVSCWITNSGVSVSLSQLHYKPMMHKYEHIYILNSTIQSDARERTHRASLSNTVDRHYIKLI